MKKDDAEKKPVTWRKPTRRMFVAMLAAAAAAIAVREQSDPLPKTRWIGHC